MHHYRLLLLLAMTQVCLHANPLFFQFRDVSTDSSLELSLVNYHRYHSLENKKGQAYIKPFFMGSKNNIHSISGVLFTGYTFITDALWLGVNSAAMNIKTQTFSSKGGLDDIQFKGAYDIFHLEDGHFTLYLIATAPTGDTTHACHPCEPLVGSKKGSFGMGINLDAVACEAQEHELSLMFDMKYRHIFGPVSLAANIIDIWLALNLPLDYFNVELGYDFWWKKPSHQPHAESQKLYLDIGYTFKTGKSSSIVGLGASYEFASKNTLEQWAVWLTAGIAF